MSMWWTVGRGNVCWKPFRASKHLLYANCDAKYSLSAGVRGRSPVTGNWCLPAHSEHSRICANSQLIWGSSGRRLKSCQPDTVYAGQMPCLTVTEGDDTGALDSVSTTAVVVAPDPRANTALTCTFCPASFPRMAGCNEARVVTRKSDDGGRAFLGRQKWLGLGFFFRSAGRSAMTAAWVIVTDLSQGASRSTVAAGSAHR